MATRSAEQRCTSDGTCDEPCGSRPSATSGLLRRLTLVNISSVAGRTARPGNAVYAATKWGMGVWSEALRQGLQPDIRVMLIEPAAVATELTDHVRRDLISRVDGLGLPVTALVPRQQSLRDATEDGSDVTLAVGMGGGF